MTTYTNVKKEDLKDLSKYGFWKDDTKTKYEVIRLRKQGVILILFTTNKLLVQGKENKVKEVEAILHELRVGKKVHPTKFAIQKGSYIGSDESLKGDSFGGIVVAAVKADPQQRQDLLFAGVMDSKKLKDFEIEVVAERIKKIVKYKIISMMPEEYNRHEKVTPLLNSLHTQVIQTLKPADYVVIDKYPGCTVIGKKETKAESKYVEVAAASILARAEGLKQFKKISEKLGFEVPKGSTHVKEALERASRSGIPLKKLAKIHFSNVQKYL